MNRTFYHFTGVITSADCWENTIEKKFVNNELEASDL